MRLVSLQADRLRNLRAVSLDLPPGLSLLVGRNGQGKTSLLEAAYLLATGRSFRTRQLPELVSWSGGPLRVAGRVATRTGEWRLAVVIDGAERRLSVDAADSSLEEYLGRLDLIALPAEWMRVLREGPEERRRFLDRGIAGLDTSYLRALAEYRRVLAQRNALLRGGGSRGTAAAEIDAWDERLAAAAARVHRRRREYAVRLAARLGEPGRALFPGDPDFSLGYRPSPARAGDEGADRFEGVMREALRKTRGRDTALGFTGEGPHRDDLALNVDGVDLRKYGSAGQVRSAMIALKLAKLELLREERLAPPLFVMDDFDADLDEEKTASLAAFLAVRGVQALLATSKEAVASGLGEPHCRIRVDGGEARVE
jgi:DNA replication and repair protein RecF